MIRAKDSAENNSTCGCTIAEDAGEESGRRGATCRLDMGGSPRLGRWSEPAERTEMLGWPAGLRMVSGRCYTDVRVRCELIIAASALASAACAFTNAVTSIEVSGFAKLIPSTLYVLEFPQTYSRSCTRKCGPVSYELAKCTLASCKVGRSPP
jgi:hypothetical protein